MNTYDNNSEQGKLEEAEDLGTEEKKQGQLGCLEEMNKILKGAIDRHETNRSNS